MSTTYYSNHWNKAIEEDVLTMRVAERGKDGMDFTVRPCVYCIPAWSRRRYRRRLSTSCVIPSHSSRPSRIVMPKAICTSLLVTSQPRCSAVTWTQCRKASRTRQPHFVCLTRCMSMRQSTARCMSILTTTAGSSQRRKSNLRRGRLVSHTATTRCSPTTVSRTSAHCSAPTRSLMTGHRPTSSTPFVLSTYAMRTRCDQARCALCVG